MKAMRNRSTVVLANRRLHHRLRSRGATIVYVTALMVVMCGFVSFGVDLARVQLTKTELQRAADAAARYGAFSLGDDYNPTTTARSRAIAAAAQNTADGSAVTITSGDVTFGQWNASNRVFTQASSGVNAIKVTASRHGSAGVPLLFGRVLGRSTCDVNVSSIAVFTDGTDVNMDVSAQSNPWLAGMPPGTIANPGNPHSAPDSADTDSNENHTDAYKTSHGTKRQTAPKVQGMTITPGQTFTFDSISGAATNDLTDPTRYGPDGNLNWIEHNFVGSEHGKSNLIAPINSVIAVFLDDTQPNLAGPVPATLDFSDPADRDFTILKPELRQVFFIGDGRASDGTVQQFVTPAGATRLYIGMMDGYEWNNNVGKYTTTIHRAPSVQLVK